MSTPLFKFATVDASIDDVALDTIVNGAVQSIEDNLPHRFVADFAGLNALNGTMYPDGQIAVLTADSTGVKAGSQFVRAGGKWLFCAGYFSDVSLFVAALTANVGALPGASFYDAASSSTRTFTNAAGANTALVLASTSVWTNIAHLPGYGNGGSVAPFGYMKVPGGVQLRGVIQTVSGKPITANDTRIGSLPTAARPSYSVQKNVTGVLNSIGTVWFKPNGDIICHWIDNHSTNWFYLDDVFLSQN